jgi:hypothetical protein
MRMQRTHTWLAPSEEYPKPAGFLQSEKAIEPGSLLRFLVHDLQGDMNRPNVSLATP